MAVPEDMYSPDVLESQPIGRSVGLYMIRQLVGFQPIRQLVESPNPNQVHLLLTANCSQITHNICMMLLCVKYCVFHPKNVETFTLESSNVVIFEKYKTVASAKQASMS